MQLIPVPLSLESRKCLVVGSHPRAEHVVQLLAAQQAQVVVIGQTTPFAKLPENALVVDRAFEAADLDDCWLVVAATESHTNNQAIMALCDKHRLFCSVVTDNNNQAATESEATTGMVSLVGAGPGDPDLLTVRALKLIREADAIVYDRLVSKGILALCRADAEYIYAGKAKANHAIPQDSINTLLVSLARKHRKVVRLKGGDPFIFGRGGEEIETLADERIPFEVVPGVTAASGCAAYSGIPLTHRDHAQACIFVTGHLRDGQINLNWSDLTDPTLTVVVYMGLTGLDVICKSLIEHGRDPQTPAALVQQGTDPQQRVLTSTLTDLPRLVAQSNVVAPTLLIIGGVVTLRERLQWFMT